MIRQILILISILFLFSLTISAQSFFFGADMSYVNEMEDCGVSYYEDTTQSDPYTIFENHGANLIRLRLWHTPKWYDALNDGQRYSDFDDIKKSIARAKENNMQVLLDFHLSDNWADPSKQLVPEAWLPVVDDLPILKDSLYNYIYHTLSELNDEDLLPEMIQIGNETNKGILLSPDDNAVWTLDWERNASLFNRAIEAVNDFELDSEKDIKIVLHLAGPSNAEWLIDGFITNGVTDFDIIGLSYYWAWHMPTSIEETGQIIRTLRTLYPDKDVMIVETGYIWTTEWNDNASNIISETHPDYHPASPTAQRDWLVAMTQEIIDAGGLGVIYWEPAWVSSPCFTQWGQGSHQEHATFFDFENKLLIPGGIEWMKYPYETISSNEEIKLENNVQILSNSFTGDIKIKQLGTQPLQLSCIVTDSLGKIVKTHDFETIQSAFKLEDIPFGIYNISIHTKSRIIKTKQFVLGKG